VTLQLIFGAMTEQRHGLLLCDLLEQANCEFLTVIFDGAIASIDPAAFK
jgi:hypothetical protein